MGWLQRLGDLRHRLRALRTGRPLPYAEPERLVQLWESHPEKGSRVVVSRGNYLDWVERARAFESLGAYMPGFGMGLTGDGPPLQVTAAVVTPSLFRRLGVEAGYELSVAAVPGVLLHRRS